MATVIPTNTTEIDDRAGNHYSIFEVRHVSGITTSVVVPDAAVSAAELPPDITAAVGLSKQTTDTSGENLTITNPTSGTSGLGFTFATGDGVKTVVINADATSGTYKIVVRMVGNAAGTSSTTDTL